jgi:hypothetical protein
MARLWQRIGGTVFFGLLVVGLWQCKGTKMKVGDKCTHNNAYVCDDATSGLICVNGTIAKLNCRGPKGCTGSGVDNSECDDTIGNPGEACEMPPAGHENLACTPDKKNELECDSGKWKLASGCKGPKGCSWTGTATELTLHCDDDFADIGDPCRTEANDANYSCTPDKKTLVNCLNNKFVAWETCRGPKGCMLTPDNKLHCDNTFAAEGDLCRDPDTSACTPDATQMLKCSAQFKWVKSSDCKKEGCKVKGNGITCK